MARFFHRFLVAAGLSVLLAHADGAWAADCFSVSWAGHQSWSDASNWDCDGTNRVPGSGDTVEITVDSPITLDRNATVQSITIGSPSNTFFNTDNGNRVLTLTANTPFSVVAGGQFIAGNSTVVINRSANTTLTSGTIAFNNLELSPALGGNVTYTFGSGVTINGDFVIKPSRATGNGTLTVKMASPLSVGRATTIQPTGTGIGAVLDTVATGNTLTSGRLIVDTNGTLTANGATIALNGSIGPLFTRTGTFNRGTSTVIMNASQSAALNSGTIDFYNLVVNMPGRTGTLGASVTVNNALTLTSGTLAVGSNTLTLNGPAIAGTPSNLATTASSNLTFGGNATGVSVPASVTALRDLKIDNVRGVTLNSSPAVGGVLYLADGGLVTGSNKVAATANCNAGSVNATNGYVNGNLQLTFPSGTAIPCIYQVGNGPGNTFMAVTMTSAGGTLTGSTTASAHPQITGSPIDPTQDANRYWSLWLSGDTINASSYSATFNFLSGDLDAGATPASFIVGQYVGGAWTAPTPVSAGSSSTRASITGPINARTDFAVGKAGVPCPVPADLPSTMTCVCDNFGRATLNPSTIYGGNWQLSTSGGAFGVPKIVNSGFLRMTDNSNNVATAATMPGVFPAAGNLIAVEFKHYAYNGSGGDGIALTLSDASIPVAPGAYGGSLGYAQKDDANCASPPCNGFKGGWIGIGVDEFGNYSAATEGRSGGSGARPDAVAVRGSGSDLTGYPHLAGTNSLSPGIDNPGSTSPAYGHAYRIMVDARDYTAANKTALVTVNRDTSGAGNFSAGNPIVNFDAYAVNPAQAAVPANWKLSFTGSTGNFTNIHEISGVKVCAQTIVPPADYRIEIDSMNASTCTTANSGKPIVTITPIDSNGNKVAGYNKTVTLSATLAGGAASQAAWSIYSANGTLSGNQYTFTAADNGVAKFYLTDSAQQDVYVSVSENGGTLSAALPTPVKFRGAAFEIAAVDPLGEGTIAGRPHLMSITRNNVCAPDTTYSGTKTLDGWYTPSTEHPAGADVPSICATHANGTCFPKTGACEGIPGVQPSVSSASNNLPALAFANGAAKFCLATSDVGKYFLNVQDDSNASSVISGFGKALTVRPFAIVVSNVNVGGKANPADDDPDGSVFTSAGTNFSATVGGYRWNSAGDSSNSDGLPDAGANWKAITDAGIAPRYADNVVLAPDSFLPKPPVDTANTSINGNVVVTGGSATVSTLAYNEVGSFTLNATPSASYLGSDVNLAPRVVIFAEGTGNGVLQERRVGRFTPDHFVLEGASLQNRSELSCSGSTFTYMGEPMKASFTLKAVSKSGNVTSNYVDDYMKFTNINWTKLAVIDSLGLWMLATDYPVAVYTCKAIFSNTSPWTTSFACPVQPPPAPISRTAGSRVTVSDTPGPSMLWSNGLGTFFADVVLERADRADGAYDTLSVGVAPTDRDGIGLLSTDLNMDADNNGINERASLGSTKVRHGRLKIFNAYGSELLPLPINLQAQHYVFSSDRYVPNTDDGCTPLAAAGFSQAQAAGATITTTLTGTGTLTGGVGKIMLSKPDPKPVAKGAIDVSSVIPYLPGTGRQTLGVYKGGPTIYMRERY